MDAEQSPKTVLVVDDHAGVRALCRTTLEPAGFRVLEAGDGEEALARIHTQRPDAILLDIAMPRLSGWEVTATLLADRATDDIPIIFISASSGPAEQIRAFELGARGYVTKPFDPTVLPETVSRVLAQIESGELDSSVAETLSALREQRTMPAGGAG